MMPLDGVAHSAGFPVPGDLGSGRANIRFAQGLRYVVTPGYGQALGLHVVEGRLFRESDLSGGSLPWIVNEEFARLYLPRNPVGRRFFWLRHEKPIELEVVGVVRNVLKDGYDRRPQPEFYEPLFPEDPVWGAVRIVVRTSGDPVNVAPVLHRLIRAHAPDAAIDIMPLSQRVAASVSQPLFATSIMATFALLALTLAALGLYAVLSYNVSQRRRELGVRAALGADRAALTRLVLREGLNVSAVGICAGLTVSAMLTHLMQGMLFGVTPLDSVAFASAASLLAGVAAAACLVPAWRAASVEPLELLVRE
jgi:hypothetical protein